MFHSYVSLLEGINLLLPFFFAAANPVALCSPVNLIVASFHHSLAALKSRPDAVRKTQGRTEVAALINHPAPHFLVIMQYATKKMSIDLLVGGLEHFLFSIIYGIILPIDQYFSRWLKPPTSLYEDGYSPI